MNPIATTNAMKPAPGKGVSSFPTPVIKDTVIVEVVNAWKGDYQPLEYGTEWDSVPHASVQGSFPDHKLVNQSPNSEDGQWVKRIWANDRVDQDTYNYAIKYSGGSDAHPIYIRTYILPREGYAPVPDLSPDPLFPGALLVDEEVQRQEDELDSRYVRVIRTYETLPGPQITSQRYTERGDIETISSQQVSPDTAPDPDGLLVTQSQVIKEDVSKGTKVTATVPSYTQLLVKEKKEGLLGETVTTDDIVNPSTQPDELSESVVASVVQQTSATKAVKRTTTASGPTSLAKKSKDGKLLGDVTQVQSIVAPDANPDSVSPSILSSEVNQVDSGKAIKTNTVLNSTPTLLGNQAGEGLLGTRTTTEVVVPSGTSADAVSTSVISSQVEPIDSVRSRKITTSSSGPTSLSGEQRAEGLLGETTVTESIVAAGSVADSLSTTVISSKVDPIDSAKSKKTTITASGPTSLSKTSKDGKLLGDTITIQSVVAPDASPDNPSNSILASEVNQIDSGKAIKTNIVLSSTPTLLGSQTGEGLLGTRTTTEDVVLSGTSADPVSINVISSQVEPIDSIRSRKITTTSLGPLSLEGKRINERGDIETIEEEIVAAGTNPDPDTLLQVSSQVNPIDEAKSKKTTSTVLGYTQLSVNEKKEGLLGETITTEDIVAPNTVPDALSQSVISSTVQKTSATKAVKRTTTASGPTSLTKKSKDGKLLGDVTSTQSVVAPDANPDSLTESILSSEVNQVDSGKAVKTNIVLNSTPTLLGYDKKAGLLGETSATETVVPAGTQPDALSQTIVSSTVEPIDSVRSRKVTVESSGPTSLLGNRINQRGDLETVSESIVSAGTNAGPDGLLVISSEVEPIDSAKSKLKTVAVPNHSPLGGSERKSGLLGEISISDNIVSAGTVADELTFTGSGGVVESTVSPISATKSKKVTVTSSGPTELNSDSLVDSPLGLVKANVEKSIVTPDTQPTDNQSQGLTTIKDNIEAIDSVKLSRERVNVVGGWPTNVGVDYDEQLGLGIYYTETIVNPEEYKNPPYWEDLSNINYKPIDQWKSLKRSVDKEKISQALLNQWYKITTEVNVSLPNKLLGVTAYWGKSFGEGGSANIDFGASTGSYNQSLSSSSKSSASINGDIYFNIEQGYSGAVPGFQHIFFMEIGSDGRVEAEEILQILNNFEQFGKRAPTTPEVESVIESVQKYKRWPYIQSRTENLVVISGAQSKTTNESKSESVTINGFGSGSGTGSSFDVDVNARSVNIPPTLHGSITIEEEFIGDNFGEGLEPTFGVRPETLKTTKVRINGAEVDAATFPTGEYLYSSNVELFKWGFVKVTAITVNITGDYV